jgi:hypothetical protein
LPIRLRVLRVVGRLGGFGGFGGFGEHALGDREGPVGGGDARVHSDLQQDLLDLSGREAVAQCGFDVHG